MAIIGDFAVNNTLILEKSVDPRKTQKARKYSKRYQSVERHPKGEGLTHI